MSLMVGRLSVLAEVATVAWSGDQLELGFEISPEDTGGDVDKARFMAQQVTALKNDQESIIPVVWDDDDTMDGFYEVLDVVVTPRPLYLVNGISDCVVSLRRVGGGYAVAPVEILQLTPGRTTDHTNSDTNSTRYAAFASDVDYEAGASPFGIGTASSADGDLRVILAHTLPSASTLYVHRYFARPARHYWGAATMEVLWNGSWYPVVGRQIPSGVERWRLSNGIIRATLSGSTVGDLVFEKWDGSTWDTAGTMQRGYENSGFTHGFFFGAENVDSTVQYVNPIVLRNDPFGVVVRVPQFAGRNETYRIQPGRWDIEIALDIRLDGSTLAQAVSFGDPADALSTFSSSYGIIRTTPSDSHRWFVGCDKDVTEDLTNGYIYLDTAAAVMNICAGIAGTASNDADRSISAFLTGSTLRTQVVAR